MNRILTYTQLIIFRSITALLVVGICLSPIQSAELVSEKADFQEELYISFAQGELYIKKVTVDHRFDTDGAVFLESLAKFGFVFSIIKPKLYLLYGDLRLFDCLHD